MLTDAIAAAGGPSYQFRDIAPIDGMDGGQVGGNIRVGFLFRPDRGLSFVDRADGGPTDAVGIDPGPRLSFSPGRIQPGSEAFVDSRKPLVGEFSYSGNPLFVVAVHLNSRIGDDPPFGRFQPPRLITSEKRGAQAAIVHDFVAELLATDHEARVIVLGDFNDFQFGPAVTEIERSGLHNLTNALPENERYSYIHEGNSQAIDHILVSQRLLTEVVEYDIVHVNSEFMDQASDHDPARALFAIAP